MFSAIRWGILAMALALLLPGSHAVVQVDPAVIFNTSSPFNAGYNFNETANFSSIGVNQGSLIITGPDGTANFNISTALNLSFRHVNSSRQLNITLNRLFWDNSSGIVNATVRGLGASQSTVVTQPNGTNVTQSADANGAFVFYWTGTQNITNITLTEAPPDSVLPNITHLSPANLTTFENRNFTVEVNASDDIGLSEVTVDAGAAGNFTNNTALVNGSNFVKLTSLNDGNITYYTVAKDAAGNINGTAKRIVTIDTKNATLSSIVASPISDRAATISFTADRQVNTTITYGTVSGTYTTNTSNTTFSTGPKVSLTELSASTTYFYRIYTWNLASNFTESAEQNFTTAAILAGGGLGGGGPPGTPEPLEKVKEAIRGAVANITAPRASILYITQDTTACWVHKLSEILPPDSPDPYDPCFPGQLYSGQYTEVGAFAYMTNGSVLSYTWWISTPDLKVQPMKSTLTVPLGEGMYPIGVDVATSTGQIYSLNRTVNVVPGLPPVKAGGAVVGEAVSNTGRASFSVVGGVLGGLGGAASSGVASGDDWGKVVWTNGKATLTKGQVALLLFGGLGYVYFNGRGGKRRR